MAQESPIDAVQNVMEKAKDAVSPFLRKRLNAEEGAVTPLKPVVASSVDFLSRCTDAVSEVASFAKDISSETSGYVRNSIVEPTVNFTLEHPEVFAAGTALSGALLRVRKGPKKMIRGGIAGGVLGAAVLFYSLG